MDYIEFQNKKFPIRYIEFEDEEQCISVESLNEILFDEKGQYVSPQAQQIDEQIFFFVEDKVIKKSEEFIIDYLEENL